MNWGQVDNRDMQMSPSAEKSTVPNSDEDKSLHDDMPIKEEDSQGRKRAKVPSSNSGEEKDDPNVFEIKKIKNRESAKRSRDKKKKMEVWCQICMKSVGYVFIDRTKRTWRLGSSRNVMMPWREIMPICRAK